MKKYIVLGMVLVGFVLMLLNMLISSLQPAYVSDSNKANRGSNGYPVSITTFDSSKKPVTMTFYQRPQRVITNELNTFETLLALDLSETIAVTCVNREGETYQRLEKEYPRQLEKFHGEYARDLNAETVLALNPDFILGWRSTFTSLLRFPTEWWNERGIRTYIVATSNHVLNEGTIEDECRFLDDMGKIFNVKEKTDARIKEIRDEIAWVRKQVSGRKSQFAMVIETSGKAFMNYDEGWLIGDMVRQLGGYMPVKERRIGYEDLLSYDPEVIFIVYFNRAQKEQIMQLFKETKFSSLSAVKNGRIYPIPFDHMYTTAIKTADGIRMVRDGLYPDLAGMP